MSTTRKEETSPRQTGLRRPRTLTQSYHFLITQTSRVATLRPVVTYYRNNWSLSVKYAVTWNGGEPRCGNAAHAGLTWRSQALPPQPFSPSRYESRWEIRAEIQLSSTQNHTAAARTIIRINRPSVSVSDPRPTDQPSSRSFPLPNHS